MMMMMTMTTMITIDRGRRSSFKVAFDIPVIEGRRESNRYLSLSLVQGETSARPDTTADPFQLLLPITV